MEDKPSSMSRSRRGRKIVELPGVEPGSRECSAKLSTCLVHLLILSGLADERPTPKGFPKFRNSGGKALLLV